MKISIITINYNDKLGLKLTIDSVVNQTYKNFEFVVIDGASSDGSKEILSQFDSKIDYWVSEPDKGIYNAMNKGIKKANGEYIIFMNSGDSFYDNFVLEKSLPYLNKKIGIVYGDSYCFDQNGFVRNEKPPKELNFNFFFKTGLIHQSVFIEKKMFYDSFFYNENYKICSDWEFFVFNICLKNVSCQYINLFISNYSLDGLSSRKDHRNIHDFERLSTYKKYFTSFYKDQMLLEEYKQNRRINQLLLIKKNKISWKIMKGILNIFTFRSSKN